MSLESSTALLLIVVPILFNVAFFELGRAFDYPDILRAEPDEILRRFARRRLRPASSAGRRSCSARSRCCRSPPWSRSSSARRRR